MTELNGMHVAREVQCCITLDFWPEDEARCTRCGSTWLDSLKLNARRDQRGKAIE